MPAWAGPICATHNARMNRASRVAAVLTVAVALLSACSTEHGPDIAPSSRTTASPAMAINGSVDHVHAAVMRDGFVLLGTHRGLVAVDPVSGAAEVVGSGRDDLMGLASDGSTLYASGHPGPGSDLPDPLGLLRSEDGGSSWVSVSLLGEVDFHGLDADGDRLVGIGTEHGVMVSTDRGVSWQDAGIDDATSVAWFDGAAWVTTGSGLRVWRDGETTAPSLAPGQPVALASASDGDALWAVFSDGTVWRSLDGSTWRQYGAVSSLEAIAATVSEAYVVAATSLTRIRAN